MRFEDKSPTTNDINNKGGLNGNFAVGTSTRCGERSPRHFRRQGLEKRTAFGARNLSFKAGSAYSGAL